MKKAAVIAAVFFGGLFLFGRWTGRSFHLDVFGPNQLGTAINQAQGASGGKGGYGPMQAAADIRTPGMDSGSIPASAAAMGMSYALPGSRPALSPTNPFPVLS